MSRLLFHSLGLLHHLYASHVSLELSRNTYDDPLVKVSMDYGMLYLTYWNLIFQMIFLSMSIICDLVELKGLKLNEKFVQLKETIFHGLVFPFTLYVSITFWTLFALDRELVYPAVLDTVIPRWLNHSVHSVVLGVLALELGAQRRARPARGPHYALVFAVMNIYSVVYHATYFLHGVWMYPFYYLMSWPLILLWQFKFIAALHLLYFIQWPLMRCLYGAPTEGKAE